MKKFNSYEYLDCIALKTTIGLGNRICSTELGIFPIEIICFHCTEEETKTLSPFTDKGACNLQRGFFINNFQTLTKIDTSLWCSLVNYTLFFF